MKRSTLEILSCPHCQAALSLHAESGNGIVDEGSLFCSQCGRSFAIQNGIVHFIDPQELEGFNRQFARSYDRLSPFYNIFIKITFLVFGGERKARKEILDRLELPGERILEVSIGTGMNLPYLFESPRVGEVFGLDISAGQLARCSSLVSKRGWPVDLFLGTAGALPFQAETFDSVFHLGGINFFSNKKGAIDEMIRVARPGCKVVIADETERVARLADRMPGLSSSHEVKKANVAVPVHLVPETMQDIQVVDIWKAHGKYHGYCLEFKKPA
jgi:ubiquinone/menaquinone biosynthesis C-methylase UbiE/uncharacterized protein YbaR (Trm112 family)